MSDQQGKAEEELIFVVTTNPSDRSSAANKRRVRSVAALRSWPERRKKTFENVDHSGSQVGGFVLDSPERPTALKTPRNVKRKRNAAELLSSPTPGELAEPLQEDEEPLFEACTRAENGLCNCIHCRSERTYLYGRAQTAAQTAVDAEPQSPINSRKRPVDGDG